MPNDAVINQEKPSAEGSAQEDWVPTSEATKIAEASARTLKRRADAGAIRRSSIYGKFGLEHIYNKEDILNLRNELRQHAKAAGGIAEAIAEGCANGAGAKTADPAGGDRALRHIADPAEVIKIIDQKITTITEPFFKLADTLETGFEKLLILQQQAAEFQDHMLEIETQRDREKQQEREEVLKTHKEERRTVRVKLICYLIVSLVFCGFVGYMAWGFYTWDLFTW